MFNQYISSIVNILQYGGVGAMANVVLSPCNIALTRCDYHVADGNHVTVAATIYKIKNTPYINTSIMKYYN